MTTQPEALRLAEDLIKTWCLPVHAAKLRRLYEVNQEALEALKLADAMLSGANMDAKVVERKVRAAIAKAEGKA